MRAACKRLTHALDRIVPPGRHNALALTAVEESMHWANAAVACQVEPEPSRNDDRPPHMSAMAGRLCVGCVLPHAPAGRWRRAAVGREVAGVSERLAAAIPLHESPPWPGEFGNGRRMPR